MSVRWFRWLTAGLLVAGACIAVPPVTWSQSTTPTPRSSSALVNLSYVSSRGLLHSTSSDVTSSAAARRQLTSPATTDDVSGHESSSRDLSDWRKSSVAAAVTSATASSDVNRTSRVESTLTATSSSSSASIHHISSTVPPSRSFSIPDVALLTSDTSVTQSPEYFKPPATRWLNDVVLVLCLLALALLFIIILVCLLRARSRHKLCWTKHRCYLPVPLFYQNGSRRAAVIHDPSLAGTVTTVGNGSSPAKGPELAPLTYV